MAPKRQILIVEDNLLNREMLAEILMQHYAVLEAENGLEALEILKQHKDHVSLILLDVMMPVMDGYTFLEKTKEDAELSLIPVIVTTQSGSEADEIAALTHGATDFVPKPYRPQVILHRVESLIKLRETAAMVNQFQYDRLTGLYSKEFFFQKVREQLLNNPQCEYNMICSNIENFKLYNETFGVSAGDQILIHVADLLKDVVGATGIYGRFSADRFLCLQERNREQEDRNAFLEEINKESSPMLKHIVMRWGIYEIDDPSIPVEQMCDRALLAVNSIKGRYNQHFAMYDDALRSKIVQEKAITDAMERALSEHQFSIYLQPKYSLNDECLIGAEALVRWIHPEWGFMSPGAFIPLFEKNGFISKLDQYVWERVCMLLHDWKKQGKPLLPISVNVSRADVYQYDLAEYMTTLTEKYDIAPGYLHLEITESAYVENLDQMITTIEALRKRGFTIEMDDFGSGYSSLNMLSQMKLDILKLDMKFIRNELAKPTSQSILGDIINMAHRMHLSVVAEGVETREQMVRLQLMKCDYVQGYYFAKPMPTQEFEALWDIQYNQTLQSQKIVSVIPNQTEAHRLLIVDEDGVYREKVRDAFGEQYEVLEAANAESALACISANHKDGICIVILSMTLPDHGADVFMKTLRQEPVFWDIPVLATIPNGNRMKELPLARETDDFMCKLHPLFDLQRRIRCLTDIAVMRKREKILRNEAYRDYQTGLLNRRGCQAVMTSLRMEDLPAAICLFDLDNLKKVNDTYGHDKGDRMIRAFADLLINQKQDGEIQCRYGGDEFLLIIKRMDDINVIIKKGQEICRLFRSCLAEEQIPASCSVGIALCETSEELSENLFERADKALYQAKRENKGGFCLWKP